MKMQAYESCFYREYMSARNVELHEQGRWRFRHAATGIWYNILWNLLRFALFGSYTVHAHLTNRGLGYESVVGQIC